MKRSTQISASAEYIDPLHIPERRTNLRHQPRSLVYVELDEGNGGIALNIGEDGLAVQAVMGLMDDFLDRVRFRLPESKEWIETGAQVIWTNETRKLLGLRFVELPEPSRQLIRGWIEREPSANRDSEAPGILGEGLEGRAAPPAIPMLVMPSPPFSEAVASEVPAPEHESPSAADKTAEAIAGHVAEETKEAAFAFQRESFRASMTGGDLPRTWSVAVFFLFLATASLATGWAVGRGALAGGIERLRKVVFREGAAGSAVPTNSSALIPQARLSEIEIVNVNGIRWTLPLTDSALPAGAQARPDSGGFSTSSSREKKAQPFRTWVLTAPVQPRAAPAPDSSEAAAPPVLGSSVDSPQNTVSMAEQPYTIPVPPPERQSVVRLALLIRRVDPVYPPLAIALRVEGTVKMHVTVSSYGMVRDIHVISGPPMLTDAAAKAASQWLYSPTLINGKPADSTADISMAFHLP